MYTKGKICLHIVQRGCDLQCLENIQGCEVNLNNRGYKIFIVGNVNKLVFVLLADLSNLLSNYLLNSLAWR